MKNADLIWQTAIVRQGDEGHWLEFSDLRACSRCSRGTGCGAALFSRLFARPDTRLRMPGDCEIPADRVVRVGLDPRWLVLAAAATYLVPVLSFVAGAVLGDMLRPESDPVALTTGLSFALAAVLLLRYPLNVIAQPRLQLVDLHQGLESADASDHFSSYGP